MSYYFVIFLPKNKKVEQQRSEARFDECVKNCDSQPKCARSETKVIQPTGSGYVGSGSVHNECIEATNYGACHNECLKNYK